MEQQFFFRRRICEFFSKFSSYSLAKTAIVRLVENIHDEFKSISTYCIAPAPTIQEYTKIQKNMDIRYLRKKW